MHARAQSTLGRALRTAREAKGWSRATLAEKAGVAAGTVSNIELYGSAPRWDTVQALANALGVDLADLIGSREPTEAAS